MSHSELTQGSRPRRNNETSSVSLTSRPCASTSTPPPNILLEHVGPSRNRSIIASAVPARVSSTRSNNSSHPNTSLRNTPSSNPASEEAILTQALEESRHAQAVYILQTAEEGSPAYLRALTELDGQAPAASLHQEGLEEHLRPPSYQVHYKDKTVNPLKYTTTSKGSDDPGDKKRITKEILAIMREELEKPRGGGENETGELIKGPLGWTRTGPAATPVVRGQQGATDEEAANATLEVASSVAETLDRESVTMMGRRPRVTSETRAQREAREERGRSRRAERERLNAPFAAIARKTQRPS